VVGLTGPTPYLEFAGTLTLPLILIQPPQERPPLPPNSALWILRQIRDLSGSKLVGLPHPHQFAGALWMFFFFLGGGEGDTR